MRQGAFLNISFDKGNNFQESFEQFVGQRLGSSPFTFRNLPQLLNNQLCQDSSVAFF